MVFNKVDKLVKGRHEDHRWLDKKFDIQGVVFLAGSRQYIEYVESLPKTYNEGDRAFYDAIIFLVPFLILSYTIIINNPPLGGTGTQLADRRLFLGSDLKKRWLSKKTD